MDIHELRNRLTRLLSNGISLNSVATSTKIKQASLWRFVKGKQSLSGDSVFRLLEYLKADILIPEDSHGEQ